MPDWLDNWQLRVPCDPLSSRACTAASEPRPPLQACGYPESMRGVWHHHDRRRRGPRELTGIAATRGKDHPTARLSGPGAGKVWHRVQELAGRARTRLACGGCESRMLDPPSRDSKNAIDDQLQDATSVPGACHIVTLAGDAPGEVRRRAGQDTTGHRGRKGDPLLPHPASPARLTHASSPHVNKNDS